MKLATRLCAWALGLTLSAATLAADTDYTLAISEGTSGGIDHARVLAKYGTFADALGKALKGKVRIVFAREFALLEEGLAQQRFDLALARPSDYPARALRDHGYRFVASAAPEGQCLIVVRKDSPLQNVAEAKGKRWVLPEQASYMSKFCRAELRDRGILIDKEKVQYVREQGAVKFFLEQNLVDVGGVASYSGVARGLEKSNLRVLHRSVTQPYFPLVAGPRLSDEQLKAIQAELIAMPQSAAGRDVLEQIGVQGFDTSTGPRLANLLDWLTR
ncbi:MAG: phosphate/phosphite/phosphonate ABC transporter substrate-binding protein [Hydrogenophaga sp.]|uniref:phosphate/phosphite/phosphonate ABC transporter substrate-binding protein n=1 Tax=Hydrogenophaga sp. TaxID=1904254 RepID=UPI001DFA3AA3|nr:PhnD/SsuA/transferrin family substrate-binding protein [Hydrogenophaga sp.]MBX3608476.1 phosphate/phosphite/phosphonate ABC transporter substrate-binding protein [Hydrogenophaga sp.]